MWGAQRPSGRSSIPGSFSFPMTLPIPIQASMTSGLGCASGLQCPPLCHLSQLSHLAKSSHTVLPRASPSSEVILLPKKQGPNSLSRYIKPSSTSLQSSLPASLLSSEFPSPNEL